MASLCDDEAPGPSKRSCMANRSILEFISSAASHEFTAAARFDIMMHV